ncbi:MAG: Uma2 family endonuclease [Chloroflexaceae bacterium]|nr:Uma2 family endonuclease [Chloroflexaceae bacterium]NJO05725.1 Uma2 family endonuclease [Chloroflexaceae bacterium]
MEPVYNQPDTADSSRMTSADLDLLPDDGKRYEIINGELHVSKQPNWHHQLACSRLIAFLEAWNFQTGAGVATGAPGLIFADDDDVAPDVIWISNERLATALHEDGKLHAAPELVIEVLSPGLRNEQRDRQTKRKLYALRGVQEYWIVDWRLRQVEVYRREQATLKQTSTLFAEDALTSPLLPSFTCPVAVLFGEVLK